MARRIYRKRYSSWSSNVRVKLRRNNFGNEGMMLEYLHYDPMTYVMLDGDELIGWALAHKYPPNGYFAMFFVKRRYRRKGVGTQLAENIKQYYKKIYVRAEDSRSKSFFNTVGL